MKLKYFGDEYTYEELLEHRIDTLKKDIDRFRRWKDDEAVHHFQGKLYGYLDALEWYRKSKGDVKA